MADDDPHRTVNGGDCGDDNLNMATQEKKMRAAILQL